MRRVRQILLLFWIFFLSATARAALEITRPILDQTVPLGTNVTFEIRYRSDVPVTIQWRHETNALRGEAASLTVTNIQPTHIGRYTVTLSAGSVRLTNSAILDINIPYPPPRFTEVSPITFPPELAGTNQLPAAVLPFGAFKNGNIAACIGSTYFPGNGFAQWFATMFGVDGETASRIWEGLNFNDYGWFPALRPTMTADENLIVGYSSFAYLRNLPQGAKTRFVVITPTGQTRAVVDDTTVLYDTVNFDADLNICPRSSYAAGSYIEPFSGIERRYEVRARATVFDKDWRTLVSKTMPPNFDSYGRAFLGRAGHTNLLPELNYQPRLSNSWIYGVVGEAGQVEWVAEAEPAASTPFRVVSPRFSDGYTLFVYEGDAIVKTLRGGEMAWRVPAPPAFTPFAATPITRFSHTMATFSFANQVRVGNQTLEASARNPWGFFYIDGSGTVRTAGRIKAEGVLKNEMMISNIPWEVPLEFVYESLGRYRTLMRLSTNAVLGDLQFSSPTNRYYVVRFEIPQPDPQTPAQPSYARNVSMSDSVTLSASPNLPGMVLYQWLRDSSPISLATNRDLTIPSFTFGDAGQYSVAIRNAYGSATNRIATLNYEGPAALAIDRQSPNELLIRWPVSAENSRIEQTTNLAQPFVPVQMDITTNVALHRFEIRVPASTIQLFFRLRPL
jgi:hypothetical protein